jgi:YNFM family putative membrane transporter
VPLNDPTDTSRSKGGIDSPSSSPAGRQVAFQIDNATPEACGTAQSAHSPASALSNRQPGVTGNTARRRSADQATPAQSIPPNSAVFAIFLSGALAFLNLYSTQPVLPLLRQVFHASQAQVGLTVSGGTLGVAISAMLLGVFAERLPRKPVIVAAALLLSVPTLLAATAHSIPVLAFWRLLQGLLLPGIFVITIAYTTEEWPAARLPQVMSIYVSGTVMGGYLGRAVGGALAERFGWQSGFLTLGTAGLLGAMALWRLLPPSNAQKQTMLKGGASSWAPDLGPMWQNLRNPRLIATFGIGFAMLFTLVSVFTYITFRLAAAPYLLSAKAIGSLFAVYMVGLVVTLVVGRYLSRIGLRTGMLSAIAVGITGTLVTLLPSLLAVGIGLALISSCVFISQTCANSFLRDAAAPGGRVSAVGLYITVYYIGGTIGGVLPATAYAWAGWPGCASLVILLLVFAFACTWFGWRGRHDPVPVEAPSHERARG